MCRGIVYKNNCKSIGNFNENHRPHKKFSKTSAKSYQTSQTFNPKIFINSRVLLSNALPRKKYFEKFFFCNPVVKLLTFLAILELRNYRTLHTTRAEKIYVLQLVAYAAISALSFLTCFFNSSFHM